MRRVMESGIISFAWISGIIVVGVVGILIYQLLYQGLPSLNVALIFGETEPLDALLLRREVYGGLFSAMIGSLLLIVVSTAWAVPMGVATGVYLAEYADSNWKPHFDLLLDVLAGVPSVVVGLFGFAFSVFLHKHVSERIYPCFLISSVALACLVLPYIIRATEQSMSNSPFHIKTTGPVLGISRFQNIVHILIPYNISSIMSGVILALGRCAEDTAVIMLTGVVAMAGIPKSLLSSYEALPFYIFHISSEFSSQEELMTGYAASIILLGICAVLFTLASVLKRRVASRFAALRKA